jgi:hypothetical protein
MKADVGHKTTPAQLAMVRLNANPGGDTAEGTLFTHLVCSGRMHVARLASVNGHLVCGQCQATIQSRRNPCP